MNRNATRARRSASLAIAVVGVIHLVLAKEYLEEHAYVGVLFIGGGLASLYVAIRLWIARDIVAWTFGALIALGMGIGFVLSRTIGLPGFKEAEWELSGIVTLVLEAGYIGALAFWLRRRTRRWHDEALPAPVAVPLERVAPEPKGVSPAASRSRQAAGSRAATRGA